MNIEKITMPKLGESVTEGTINSWLVKEGDYVNKYDPIADVMTDKVNAEIPSSFSGTIKEIVIKEGETASVGELICYVQCEVNQLQQEKPTQTEEIVNNDQIESTEKDVSMKARYSPAVLKMAAENNIELTTINGTGLGGRITRKNIQNKINELPNVATTERKQQQQTNKQPKPIAYGKDIEIPITRVRKVIAENMVQSKQEIPHAWMMVEADVTDLVKYRNKIKESFKEQEGYSITYFAFFVKIIATALKEFPQLNSMWSDDKIIQRNDINISIAVAKENELFVPVIKNADEMSIKGIAREIYDLALKARTGKLTADDMSDGTFTVNNTGTFGSISSMGIINHPQAAILQVESIVKKPVIINDMFAARDIVNLSLSLDHRILDGLVCGRFLARIKQLLQDINEQDTNIY